jgi:hypothetical protein
MNIMQELHQKVRRVLGRMQAAEFADDDAKLGTLAKEFDYFSQQIVETPVVTLQDARMIADLVSYHVVLGNIDARRPHGRAVNALVGGVMRLKPQTCAQARADLIENVNGRAVFTINDENMTTLYGPEWKLVLAEKARQRRFSQAASRQIDKKKATENFNPFWMRRRDGTLKFAPIVLRKITQSA